MALNLTNGQYLTLNSALAAAYPCTVVVWVKPTATTDTQSAFESVKSTDATERWELRLQSDGVGTNPFLVISTGAAASDCGGYDVDAALANVWTMMAGRMASAVSRTATSGDTHDLDITSVAFPGGQNTTRVGRRAVTDDQQLIGRVARLAFYTRSLSDAELEQLRTGASPTSIADCAHYWSFDTNAVCAVDGTTFTATGGPTYVADLVFPLPEVSSVNVDENGMDVRVNFSTDVTGSPAGFTLYVDESPVDTTALQTGARQVRLRLSNESSPITQSNTATLSYDSDIGTLVSVGGALHAFDGQEISENNSGQTATTIYQHGVQLEFSGLFPDTGWRGIYANGDWWTTKNPDSRTPATTGTGASLRNGSKLNLRSSYDGDQYLDGRCPTTSIGAPAAFPLAMVPGDALVCGMSIGTAAAWQANHLYARSAVVTYVDSGVTRYFVCSTSGTSHATTEPTWANAIEERQTIADGTAVWTNHGRTPINSAMVLTRVAVGPAQTDFRPPYASGADKTARSSVGLLTNRLPGWAATASTPTSATAIERVRRPVVEQKTSSGGEGGHPFLNQPGYGTLIGGDAAAVGAVLLCDEDHTDELLVHAVQRGLDLIGIAQGGDWSDSGGYAWPEIGGTGQGRALYYLLAVAMLGLEGNTTITSLAPHFGEFNATFYVTQADVDLTHAINDYVYAPGDEFPSDVVGSWLYVPECGLGHALTPEADNKAWASTYRGCCQAQYWWVLALLGKATGISDIAGTLAFYDYQLRFFEVEDTNGGTFLGTGAGIELWLARQASAYGALTCTATAVSGSLTLIFNRYATFSTNGFTLPGVTIGSWTQTAPRTWSAPISGDYSEKTLAYSAVSGDITDAHGDSMQTNANVATFSSDIAQNFGSRFGQPTFTDRRAR